MNQHARDDDPVGDGHPEPVESSFFADRYDETHVPWLVPGSETGLSVPVPDDRAVAELDDAGDALDVLETLCGPHPETGEPAELFDDVCDALDAAYLTPAEGAGMALEHFRLTDPPVVGWWGLVERINLYGAGIEFDLDSRGFRWGLHDYFAGTVPGGWDHLLRMIDRLPMGSHYRAALANDDELARRVFERNGGPDNTRRRPPLEGFDAAQAALHRIEYRLTYIAWSVFAAQSGKKRSSPPRPDKGPETAAERVEFEDFLREHDEIVSQVLKSKGGSGSAAKRAPVDPPAIGWEDSAPAPGPRAMGDGAPGDDESTMDGG